MYTTQLSRAFLMSSFPVSRGCLLETDLGTRLVQGDQDIFVLRDAVEV